MEGEKFWEKYVEYEAFETRLSTKFLSVESTTSH